MATSAAAASPGTDGTRRRDGVAWRAGVGCVVLLLVLLQALGPFLHAHARTAQGGVGLHLHVLTAAPSPIVVDTHRSDRVMLSAILPDEGAAICLTTEYRRDAELAPAHLALSLLSSPPTAVDQPAQRDDGRTLGADADGMPSGPPSSRRPPPTAPPLA